MSTTASGRGDPDPALRDDPGGLFGEVASADGVPVRYAVHGGGRPAIVFVHGWSCDRRYWHGQLGHFAARFTVVTVDLAGHGASGTGRRDWTMPAFGADVAAVVTGLDLPEVVLVGHSMGGDVVVEAALLLRPRVRGLVWVDVYSSLDESGSQAQTEQETVAFMAPFRADFAAATRAFVRRIAGADTDPDLVDQIAADMAAAPPDIALDAMRYAINNERAAIVGLRHAAVPIVAINAGSRPTDIDSLARHGITTEVLPAAGHFLMLQDPPGFNHLLDNAIDEFLTR
jgi:pimeloyl-ACP methyl ester carboxylesterase